MHTWYNTFESFALHVQTREIDVRESHHGHHVNSELYNTEGGLMKTRNANLKPKENLPVDNIIITVSREGGGGGSAYSTRSGVPLSLW